jgi:hypothetical protein
MAQLFISSRQRYGFNPSHKRLRPSTKVSCSFAARRLHQLRITAP